MTEVERYVEEMKNELEAKDLWLSKYFGSEESAKEQANNYVIEEHKVDDYTTLFVLVENHSKEGVTEFTYNRITNSGLIEKHRGITTTETERYIRDSYDGDPSEENIRRIVKKTILDTKKADILAMKKLHINSPWISNSSQVTITFDDISKAIMNEEVVE